MTQFSIGDRVNCRKAGKARSITRTIRSIEGETFTSEKGETIPVASINFNYTTQRG
jgi:hypothetical protein